MKKILVVDDEEDILFSLKTILTKQKYSVLLARNGDECLEILKTEKPDLILLDVMMPGTPVRDIVKKIKKVPIVFVTAVRMSEGEKEQLFQSSLVKGYIEKPFSIKSLLTKIKEILK